MIRFRLTSRCRRLSLLMLPALLLSPLWAASGRARPSQIRRSGFPAHLGAHRPAGRGRRSPAPGCGARRSPARSRSHTPNLRSSRARCSTSTRRRMEITDPDGDPNVALVRHQRPAGRRTDDRPAADWATTLRAARRRPRSTWPATPTTRRPDLRRPRAAARAAAARRRRARSPSGSIGDGVVDRRSRAWPATASRAAYRLTVPGIDHQVAAPFWAFMNSTGLVWENGQYVTAQLFLNPYYATGYPITEAYWASVKVGGTLTAMCCCSASSGAA